ncbi:MAG: hypothetical protein B7C24_11320 [Bacteroidetes bacterium 4572_77]|nr:MAG: hypothetical protein B7C24_11320 [Bacteroidetes bacterium 4572_77]
MDFTLFKRNYYCLVAGLPDLMMDAGSLSNTSLSFKEELAEQLHASDYRMAALFYLQYDNKNLLNILLNDNQSHSPLANYTESYLQEQIKEVAGVQEYIGRFIHLFKEDSFDKSSFNSEKHLWKLYYEYVLQSKNDFLKQWFYFDYNLKNIQTAVNCHQYGFQLEEQLIPIEGKDDVYKMLLKGAQKPEMFADEVPYAEKIWKIADSNMDITKKEKAMDAIRWEYLDEHTFFNYFSIEKILSFLIKLSMVERWMLLDKETGKALFEKLINDIKTNYKFPEEFSVKSKISTH